MRTIQHLNAPRSEASESFLSVRTQEGFSRYTISAYQLQHHVP